MFAAVTAVGVIRLNPSAAVAAAGAVVAVGAAVPLVLRWRPALLYAAVATAGIAVLGNGTVEQRRLVRGVPADRLVRADRPAAARAWPTGPRR